VHVGAVMSINVVSVAPGDSVQDAVRQMIDAHIGAVAVCDGTKLVGIFSERDVLRLAADKRDFDRTRIADVMTSRLVTASPDTRIIDAAHLMGEHKIRHLPIVEGDNLVGMVGIRDVMRTLVERVWSAHDPDAHDTAGELLRRHP
jgi:CBS domain-containing protein